MSTRVDPGLLTELKTFGAVNPEACINCGNCTAICPLTSDDHPFPRRAIRLVQMGLRDRLAASVDPWLCYYCGDCSKTCPRGAEPAETMMAARRWLIANYDRSGHSKKLYTSEKALVLAVFRTAVLPLVLLIAYHLLTGGSHLQTDRVALNEFAPVLWVWALVLVHFAFLGWRLVRNSRNMARQVLGPKASLASIPVKAYVAGFREFVSQFMTQRQWTKCNPDESSAERSRWLKHLLLVTGYVTMLFLVVPFLWWFQTDELYPLYHPQRWLGYYATLMLIFTSVEILYSRIKKKEEIHRFSHPSDWLFPIFLLVGSITGILVHIFRYMALPWPTYGMYTFHVMAMLAMLDTEVGIGKWTHLIYRPLALSLDAVQKHVDEYAGQLAPAD